MTISFTSTGVLYPDSSTRTTALNKRYRDKAIFGFGTIASFTNINDFNIVNNNGGVGATNTNAIGFTRTRLAAASYGGDKAVFGFGLWDNDPAEVVDNFSYVSNLGVFTADTTGVGTARAALAAAGYGGDKAIFGYGNTDTVNVSLTNLISNTGVVANDVAGVGTARVALAAAGYGGDKAIFGYGESVGNVSMTNLVSNVGVVASNVTGVGTARSGLAAAGYGGDKAIFGYGYSGAGGFALSMTNLVSNIGVVSADVTGVGYARYYLAAAGFGS
jgi:hypothetical protein